MKRIELNGAWNVKGTDAYALMPPERKNVLEWFPAQVPGTIHTDLLAQQYIPDPFYRMQELDVQWVENLQWYYQREFSVDDQLLKERHIVLVAEGVDTYAEFLINGRSIAKTENMFVEHRFDIKKYLKKGNNTIEVRLDSPVVRSKALEKKHGRLQVALEPHRVYVRKAQYSYSWDWGPKLTTSGIWRSIYLEAYSGPVLRHPFVTTTSLKKRSAEIEVSVEIEQFKTPVNVTVRIEGKEYSEETVRRARSSTLRFTMPVASPDVWWPNGYGEQPLYTATFIIRNADGTESRVSTTFGIRTIRLEQEKDSEGRSFIILVNGERIFCKGADWIPSDSFIPRIPGSTYERLLTLAHDAHMNMIRVWGGGIYEQDAFYEQCDRLGLLVWQDFMFACGEYPQTSWFVKLVSDEATKAVKRLRNHPSLAVWCGNNECEWLYCTENPGKGPDDMTGAVLFREILPGAVSSLDGSRPYWRSSPFGAGFPNAESNGTHHQWHVWSFWKDFKEYEKVNPRFVSEFGFQAPANMRTWVGATSPEDRTPQHPVIEHHNKQVEGQERLFRFQAAHYTVGKNFHDFVYRGQLVQANALKTAVEHWRRRMFKTSGVMFWQLNDCWPVSSWSVIDSALRPKASYFYAKRFYAKVLVSIRLQGNTVEVWGTNDTLEKVQGTLRLKLLTVRGETLFEHDAAVALKPNCSSVLAEFPSAMTVGIDPQDTYASANLLIDGHVVSENRFFFAEQKHMHLPAPALSWSVVDRNGGTYQLAVRAEKFAKDVRIEIDGCDAELSDNYFDLDAGSRKVIHCTVPPPIRSIDGLVHLFSLQND
jgi:beta-mannosidase